MHRIAIRTGTVLAEWWTLRHGVDLYEAWMVRAKGMSMRDDGEGGLTDARVNDLLARSAPATSAVVDLARHRRRIVNARSQQTRMFGVIGVGALLMGGVSSAAAAPLDGRVETAATERGFRTVPPTAFTVSIDGSTSDAQVMLVELFGAPSACSGAVLGPQLLRVSDPSEGAVFVVDGSNRSNP